MKARKSGSALFGLWSAAILVLLMAAGCRRQGEGYIDQMLALESSGFKGQTPQLSTVEDLKKAIEENRAEVEKKAIAAKNLGVYRKMLALKYMDAGMYGLALETLEQAIDIFPENAQLFYYSAICSARVAKAEVRDPKKATDLFLEAETLYKRALFLDPVNTDAMYGLAVLYAVELGMPEEAEPIIRNILKRESKNMDALFLLARVLYQRARPEEAMVVYDDILALNPPEKIKSQAQSNRKQIEEELYDVGP
jgi:tetratricopeptide (TPR) repeat protein